MQVRGNHKGEIKAVSICKVSFMPRSSEGGGGGGGGGGCR